MMTAVPGCWYSKINTFFLLTLFYVMQNPTRAISVSRYYLLSRDRAILQHNQQIVSRKARMIGDISYENSELLMPFSEIDKHFVEQDFIMSHRHSCPSLSDFNTTTIKVCPSYRVLDVDVNREPVALYQVLCRCLHCLAPWVHYHTPRRCTPLFYFLQVRRVIGRTSSGNILYAQR
ncbi:uncharacterized protein LOC132758249 isoform X2 [Ruditapes philippinarum]|uniref:uncharacterized protein LOC132758249 isoform X2 n=1 Tax=Ruditapes philippinarum TaxID=129788 RepID=UPI00295B21F5|nr:uncharacterized protein LOC132758249 isoform X2 [Ruditapes philippinarum]